MAPASCLLSKQLLAVQAVQAAKLLEVLARFEPEMLFLSLSLSLSPAASCPSSLRCCSQAQNCSFPSFPPAQCLPSIIHIPTLLSHCENPSVKLCCHTLTFIIIPPSSVKLHHSYPCLISLWSTMSEVTRFCGSEWWSREGTSESFESQIKSTFRQTN